MKPKVLDETLQRTDGSWVKTNFRNQMMTKATPSDMAMNIGKLRRKETTSACEMQVNARKQHAVSHLSATFTGYEFRGFHVKRFKQVPNFTLAIKPQYFNI